MESRGRSGRYVAQPTGYRAFIPAPLPPNPPIQIDDELLTLLSSADRALGRLDGSTEALPNPELFVMMYVRKEAVLSSQIEGTQASLAEVLEVEAKVLNPENPSDVAEVVNYVSALSYGLERLKTLPVSLRLICEIHEKLLTETRGQEYTPGQFRRSQNWIGPQGCTLKDASFIPPPPTEMMESLGQLESFLHDENPTPFLFKLGLAHAQFETIHPFLDGNGRIGRLLVTFLLCEKNILARPLLYLSYYLKRHRTEYYDRLQAVRDKGEWEAWLKFFLRGVSFVANDATRVAKRIVTLREEQRAKIANLNRTVGDALKVHDHLFEMPFTTVSKVRDLIGKEFPTANRLVAEFEKLGILTEVSGRSRNRLYLHDKYLSLFEDDEVSDDQVLFGGLPKGN